MNNRDGRPHEEKTISVYSVPAKNLDGWLTANGDEGDFTVVHTSLLNRYFREYYLEHGQSGTHTLQRNLIQHRYAAVKGRPKTLSADFVDDRSRPPGAGAPGTSRPLATTRSSVSCAAKASAGQNCSACS